MLRFAIALSFFACGFTLMAAISSGDWWMYAFSVGNFGLGMVNLLRGER